MEEQKKRLENLLKFSLVNMKAIYGGNDDDDVIDRTKVKRPGQTNEDD